MWIIEGQIFSGLIIYLVLCMTSWVAHARLWSALYFYYGLDDLYILMSDDKIFSTRFHINLAQSLLLLIYIHIHIYSGVQYCDRSLYIIQDHQLCLFPVSITRRISWPLNRRYKIFLYIIQDQLCLFPASITCRIWPLNHRYKIFPAKISLPGSSRICPALRRIFRLVFDIIRRGFPRNKSHRKC